jgi:hypothetical protein
MQVTGPRAGPRGVDTTDVLALPQMKPRFLGHQSIACSPVRISWTLVLSWCEEVDPNPDG